MGLPFKRTAASALASLLAGNPNRSRAVLARLSVSQLLRVQQGAETLAVLAWAARVEKGSARGQVNL